MSGDNVRYNPMSATNRNKPNLKGQTPPVNRHQNPRTVSGATGAGQQLGFYSQPPAGHRHQGYSSQLPNHSYTRAQHGYWPLTQGSYAGQPRLVGQPGEYISQGAGSYGMYVGPLNYPVLAAGPPAYAPRGGHCQPRPLVQGAGPQHSFPDPAARPRPPGPLAQQGTYALAHTGFTVFYLSIIDSWIQVVFVCQTGKLRLLSKSV